MGHGRERGDISMILPQTFLSLSFSVLVTYYHLNNDDDDDDPFFCYVPFTLAMLNRSSPNVRRPRLYSR